MVTAGCPSVVLALACVQVQGPAWITMASASGMQNWDEMGTEAQVFWSLLTYLLCLRHDMTSLNDIMMLFMALQRNDFASHMQDLPSCKLA